MNKKLKTLFLLTLITLSLFISHNVNAQTVSNGSTTPQNQITTDKNPQKDEIKEPDFGPYLKNIQRRIKKNWTPSKEPTSIRTIALFTLERDGTLSKIKLKQSSGSAKADNAALRAIKSSAPFRPLPKEYKGNSIDVDFTFDYNVLGRPRPASPDNNANLNINF